MDVEDKTPVEPQTPWDLVFQKLDAVHADAQLAVSLGRENSVLLRSVSSRLSTLEFTRLWLPGAALLASAIAIFRSL